MYAEVTPLLFRGELSVGLAATLISVSSIIAADTGAFLGGKVCMKNVKMCILMSQRLPTLICVVFVVSLSVSRTDTLIQC